MNEGDRVKNYLDNFFVPCPDAKIHKDDFLKLYNDVTHSNVSWAWLLGEIKRLGFEYDRKLRINGSSQGCIIGLKYENQTNIDVIKEWQRIKNKLQRNKKSYRELGRCNLL